MECPACGSHDTILEDDCWMCDACGNVWEPSEQQNSSCPSVRPVVGSVLEVEAVPKKSKLVCLQVDLGDGQPIQVVTNAFKGSPEDVMKYIDGRCCWGRQQWPSGRRRVVVAPVGAVLTVDGEETTVKKANVGGKPSEGMLCDAGMLGWVGGAAGAAVLLPADSFENGCEPPDEKPR